MDLTAIVWYPTRNAGYKKLIPPTSLVLKSDSSESTKLELLIVVGQELAIDKGMMVAD